MKKRLPHRFWRSKAQTEVLRLIKYAKDARLNLLDATLEGAEDVDYYKGLFMGYLMIIAERLERLDRKDLAVRIRKYKTRLYNAG